MKQRILSDIIGTLLVGIVTGGLLTMAFIFDDATVRENTRAFWFAIFG
jgi:hypothetical protein